MTRCRMMSCTTGHLNNRENDVGQRSQPRKSRTQKAEGGEEIKPAWRNVPRLTAGEQTDGCEGAREAKLTVLGSLPRAGR
jgi:hypothetical protein